MFPYFDPLANRTLKFNQNHDEQGRFAATAWEGLDKTPQDAGTKEHNASSIHTSETNSVTQQPHEKVAQALLSQGFTETTTEKNRKNGRFFSKENGSEFGQNSPGFTHHGVVVSDDGSWRHTSEGSHRGNTADDLVHITDNPSTHAGLSAETLAASLRSAEAAHAVYEKTLGHRDEDWAGWYGKFMANGNKPPAVEAAKPSGHNVFLPGDTAPTHQNSATTPHTPFVPEAHPTDSTPPRRLNLPVLSDFMAGVIPTPERTGQSHARLPSASLARKQSKFIEGLD